MDEERALNNWQRKLLPLMASLLVLLTVFFCVGISVEAYRIQKHIEDAHEIDLRPAFAALSTDSAKSFENRMDLARLETVALLESNALQSRYHQATIAVLIRVCIIFLGFLTGMALALVGAAFILGKLREAASNMEAQGGAWKLAITSTSPGLILAVLGTALMMATIWARVEVNVTDAALYFTPVAINTQKVAITQTAPANPEQPADKTETRSNVLRDLVKPKPK
jgi:hypothetical protein